MLGCVPENKSPIGHASITVSILNRLKQEFDLNRTGDLRVNVRLTRAIVEVGKQVVLLHNLSVCL